MTTSQRLLAEYLTSGSEAAFRQLVERYTNLVYSTALRLVEDDTHRAEDVAQTVFVDLAHLVRKLSGETMLGGWLYRHTCFVAAKAMRGERRRQAREREATQMNAQEDHSEANFAQVAPVLDEAISQLAPEDQSAIVLRFFEQLDFPSLGEALGSTEQAARKRVSRALDKLHDLLTARGVTLSATALGTALAARAVEAAPAEVVASLANTALASAGAGPGTALTLLKGMTVSKVSLSVASVVGIAGVTWLAWSLWWPWWPAKPPPLVLNGTWTVLSKAQPLGHIQPEWIFTLDPEGQLYVADSEQGGRIQKRDRDGRWSLVASGRWASSLACDDSGNLYVGEWGRIQKRDREGHWTTLATKGKELGEVFDANALALDRGGNLYVKDRGKSEGGENRIVLRNPDGQWTLLAGEGRDVGEFAELGYGDLATDTKENLYVADTGADRIQKRDATGRWSVVEVDPLAVGALSRPAGVAVDASGALYVVEYSGRDRLLKKDGSGHWSVLATNGRGLGQLNEAQHLSIDSTGALYVANRFPPRLEKRDPNGTWTVVCAPSTEPGIFSGITQLAVDSHGSLYAMDWGRQQVQKRDPKGRWTVLFDPADQPQEFPSFAVDRQDNFYVADKDFSRVMKRNPRGDWELYVPPGSGIGQTQRPYYLSVDTSDNLYVIDSRQCRLQKRDRRGRWTVLAEPGPEQDPLALGQWEAVAGAPKGNIYVADSSTKQVLRMLDSKGRWTTVAAFGHELGRFNTVRTLATDSFGRLYVTDFSSRVQIRDLDGKWYELPAPRSAEHPEFLPWNPSRVAVDSRDVVYIAANSRVLRWTPQPSAKTGLR
jgi:RNA polymerase sigma factor (sigma-70 family)